MFIAHHPSAIVTHLKALLPDGTLSDAAWMALSGTVAHMFNAPDESPPEELPPSAQKPTQKRTSSQQSVAPDLPSPSAKRARTAGEDEIQDLIPAALLEQIVESSPPEDESDAHPDDGKEEPAAQAASPVYHTTVSNNMARAAKRREKNQQEREVKRKSSIGLYQPPASANAVEQAIFNSITKADEDAFSWLFKQPVQTTKAESPILFQDAISEPYKVASSLVKKANLVGSEAAWKGAADFINTWRHSGSPFQDVPSLPSSQLAGRRSLLPWSQPKSIVSQSISVDTMLRRAFTMAEHFEKKAAVAQLQYRWTMAFLGYSYTKKIESLREEDKLHNGSKGRRNGKGSIRTEAMDTIMESVGSTTLSRANFRRYIASGMRWWEAASTLGWGGILSLPCDDISRNWVEKELTAGLWHVWLGFVKHTRLDIYIAGKEFETWLGIDGIEGGSLIGKETLRIEKFLEKIEEVQDSDEESCTLSQQPESQQSEWERPTKALLQMKLTDLFKPQR